MTTEPQGDADLVYYVEYPGQPGDTKLPIPERLHDTYEQAVNAAKGIYRDSDLPKVVVCEFPSLRRVAGIWGDRMNPEVHRR